MLSFITVGKWTLSTLTGYCATFTVTFIQLLHQLLFNVSRPGFYQVIEIYRSVEINKIKKKKFIKLLIYQRKEKNVFTAIKTFRFCFYPPP